MGANGVQFAAELKRESEKVKKEFLAFRADLIGDMLSVAARLSPVGKTKTLVRSWGAGTSRPSKGGFRQQKALGWDYGSLAVRTKLRTARVGATVWAGNSWFVSGFFENGTRSRQTKTGAARGSVRARHMLARGIESVKGRRA